MLRDVLTVADSDRIDALGTEMRAAFAALSKKVDDGFSSVVTEREHDRAYLKKVLFEGNGKRALFGWLDALQRWQDARDVEADKRKEDRQGAKRDTRRFMFDLLKEAFRSGLGLLIAIWLGHTGGLF